MTPLIPPVDPDALLRRLTVRLQKRTWKRLSEIARAESTGSRKLSRNDVIGYFLSWAIEQWEKEHKHYR